MWSGGSRVIFPYCVMLAKVRTSDSMTLVFNVAAQGSGGQVHRMTRKTPFSVMRATENQEGKPGPGIGTVG